MSVKIMGMVFDLEMDPERKFVLLAYADHADHDGGSIFPAVARIAKKTGYSERTVQRSTRTLEEEGYLVADGSGPHGTNKWCIPISGGEIRPTPRGDSPTPLSAGLDDARVAPGVTKGAVGGDIAMAPESSFNHHSTVNIKPPSEKPDFVNMSINNALELREIRIYHSITGRTPGDGQWETIWQTIQGMRSAGQPTTYERLRPFYLEWCRRGYNSNNLSWLTEWATNGKIPEDGHKQTHTTRTSRSTQDAIQEVIRGHNHNSRH